MECDNCGKEIKPGEHYYCLSISEEYYQGDVIKVINAEALEVRCKKCGHGLKAKEEKAIPQAAMN